MSSPKGNVCRIGIALLLAIGASGCMHGHPAVDEPNELARVSLPPYTISPPDILLIDAVSLTPRPPYRIEPLDVLAIVVTDPDKKAPLIEGEPISGLYSVTPEGTVDLGFSYGSVKLRDLTLAESRKAIEQHL